MRGHSRFQLHILLGLFTLAVACQGSPRREAASSVEGDTLERVIARGEIRAGYFIEPPTVMKNPNTGEVYGTYVDAIKAIADEMGVRVRFIEVDLAKFAAGLQNDLYDVSIGSTFRTISRAKAVDFTETIFYLGYDGVTKKGRGGEFRAEADIDRKGVRVAVKEGSAIHTYVRKRFKNANVIVLSGTDLSLPLQAVSSGQADVGLMNEHTVEFYARSHSDVEIILKDKPIQVLGMSWAVRPHDQRWLNFLNISLEALISTGQMAAWERKYYGEPLRRTIVEPVRPTVRETKDE
jgi:ABC-type amino acid transport substrate-binding protein